MALTVAHAFVSAIADDPVAAALGEILPQAHWNAGHTITGVASIAQGGTGLGSYTIGDLPPRRGGANATGDQRIASCDIIQCR